MFQLFGGAKGKSQWDEFRARNKGLGLSPQELSAKYRAEQGKPPLAPKAPKAPGLSTGIVEARAKRAAAAAPRIAGYTSAQRKQMIEGLRQRRAAGKLEPYIPPDPRVKPYFQQLD